MRLSLGAMLWIGASLLLSGTPLQAVATDYEHKPPPTASGGDRVWEDRNGNGVQDCTDTNGNGILGDINTSAPDDPALSDQGDECDAGIPGVAVFGGNWNGHECIIPDGTTPIYTDENGFYLFTDVAPGDYCARFSLDPHDSPGLLEFCGDLGAPAFTTHSGDVTDENNSDVDPEGLTGGVTLNAGDFIRYVDAGIVCPAKIGDRVWFDLNRDGIQDCTDTNGNDILGDAGDSGDECDNTGVPGFDVELYECVGGQPGNSLGQTRITVADGRYTFGGANVGGNAYELLPGEYAVRFDPASLPGGYEFTTPNVGDDDQVDSNCLAPGGVTACTSVGSRGINLGLDCGIVPSCGLDIDKQCRIETPPAPAADDAKCDGKLKEVTVKWTGSPVQISGLPNDDDDGLIETGQEVTFIGPFADNDIFVYLEYGDGSTGVSKFHTSCSDHDMDGDSSSNEAQSQVSPLGRDCGKNQGDAKDNGDAKFVNDWLLEGFVDNSDQVLDCTAAPESGDGFTQSCSFEVGPGPSCETLDAKPTSLTFKYTGGGCDASDNSQDPDKAVCTSDGTVGEPINVLYAGSDDKLMSNAYTVTGGMNIDEGDTFTISADSFSSNSYLQIGDGVSQETNQFHTSCSQPLAVGDVFGSLTLVGFNGQTGGVDVSYKYTVSNAGEALTGVTVSDDPLGPVAGPFNLAAGETRDFFVGPVSITETTTNVATVSAGTWCSATDTTTVTAREPTCDVSVAFKELQDDKVKYELTNNNSIVATVESFVMNFPAAYGVIKEVKLDGALYKSDDSDLVVGPGVTIGPDDWTNPEAHRYELDPGETRTLEVVFTTKHKGGDWVTLASAGGLVTFEESCEVELRAPSACQIERPTELVFEYTGEACSATTNSLEGSFECSPADDAIGDLIEVEVTKDEDKLTVEYTADGFRLYRSDDPGREMASDLEYTLIGTLGTQTQKLHTSCSKDLNLDDQFGAIILREFYPKTH